MITPGKADEKIKIILAGPQNAGKTMFVWRFSQNASDFKPEPTIGATFVCHNVEVSGKMYKVHIWDTAGQETYHSITAPYFRSSSGILLLFDLTDINSFQTLGDWFQMIENNTRTMPTVYVIGNKNDREERVISTEDAEEFCLSRGCRYWETSAVTGENVQEAVRELISQVVRDRKDNNEPETMGTNLRYNETTSSCC